VAEGRADLAALDAVSWALVQDHEPAARALRVIEATAPTPALPYITAATRDPGPIRAALAAGIADPAEEDRAALHLHGVVEVPRDAYLAVPTPSGPEAGRGADAQASASETG